MLGAELYSHPGYTKYNYKNKSNTNSRNGHKEKRLYLKV